ncbi:MAG: hypothetical protein MUE73_12045 [Planctomycetes bacterium]|jgi:hypothetical protein|nr:hypothetical protein [Planctomycetota bacterium]
MKKVLIALVLPLLASSLAEAQEKGEYKRWKLDFTRGEFANVFVTDALGKTHVSWYLTFSVKNGHDRDVPLGLRVLGSTDTKQEYRGTIAPQFQSALEKKTGRKYKSALDLSKGTIAAGETVEGVVFFGNVDPNMDWMTIRVYGLYDTIEQIDGKLYFEQRVLVLTYYRPGDEFGAAGDEIHFKRSDWVIEGERVEIPQKKPWQ